MLIAECCSNHEGNMELARKMILSAKENGADLVKFQLYDAEDDKGKPHYEWVKKAELSFDQAKMLFDYGAENGIEVFFSVFDVERVDWCEKIGVKRYKIASNFNAITVIELIRETWLPVIVSGTGWDFDFIRRLYCCPSYPAKADFKGVNFSSTFQGYSDHTIGLDAAKIALARGAQIIEKHFILDRENSQSPEREWSMTPDELRELKRWENICRRML